MFDLHRFSIYPISFSSQHDFLPTWRFLDYGHLSASNRLRWCISASPLWPISRLRYLPILPILSCAPWCEFLQFEGCSCSSRLVSASPWLGLYTLRISLGAQLRTQEPCGRISLLSLSLYVFPDCWHTPSMIFLSRNDPDTTRFYSTSTIGKDTVQLSSSAVPCSYSSQVVKCSLAGTHPHRLSDMRTVLLPTKLVSWFFWCAF